MEKIKIKKKIKIINGINNLIMKEIKKKNMKNEFLYGFLNNFELNQNLEHNNQINIFNSILDYNKNINEFKNDSKVNFSSNINNNNCNIHQESFTLYIPNDTQKSNLKNQKLANFDNFTFQSNNIDLNKMNYLWNNKRNIIQDNIYYILLNKISVNVSETINLLMSIQHKLYEYMNSQNNDMIYNEIILINELIKMKSNTIKNSLYDYNRELLSLPNYLYINSFSLIN